MKSNKFDLIEGIGAAYNYVLKHTPLEPSDDLYQDIAVDYIERYNKGKPHSQIITNLRSIYSVKCKRMADRNIIVFESGEVDEDTLINSLMQSMAKDTLMEVLSTLNEREKTVIIKHYFENMAFKQISHEFGFTSSYIPQVEHMAIRKLRHPSRAKKLRDFYWSY